MSDQTTTTDRTCQPWRCVDSCWGLPGCAHPERIPFYNIKPPSPDELQRRDQCRRMARWILYAVIVVESILILAAAGKEE